MTKLYVQVLQSVLYACMHEGGRSSWRGGRLGKGNHAIWGYIIKSSWIFKILNLKKTQTIKSDNFPTFMQVYTAILRS